MILFDQWLTLSYLNKYNISATSGTLRTFSSLFLKPFHFDGILEALWVSQWDEVPFQFMANRQCCYFTQIKHSSAINEQNFKQSFGEAILRISHGVNSNKVLLISTQIGVDRSGIV